MGKLRRHVSSVLHATLPSLLNKKTSENKPNYQQIPHKYKVYLYSTWKEGKKYSFSKRNLPFFGRSSGIKSTLIGSNCWSTVSWTQINTASVLVSGFHNRGEYFIYGNYFEQNGGFCCCFMSTRLFGKKYRFH